MKTVSQLIRQHRPMAATVLLALGEGCRALRYRLRLSPCAMRRGVALTSTCAVSARSWPALRGALLLWVSTWFAMLGQWLAASRRS
jgi:hypothetical protein